MKRISTMCFCIAFLAMLHSSTVDAKLGRSTTPRINYDDISVLEGDTNSVLIDFEFDPGLDGVLGSDDDIPLLENTYIDDQFVPQGVRFSLIQGGYPFIATEGLPRVGFRSGEGQDDIPAPSGVNTITDGGSVAKDLAADFELPVSRVSLIIIDFRHDCNTPGDANPGAEVRLNAYSEFSSLVDFDSYTTTGLEPEAFELPLEVQGNGIVRVELVGTTIDCGIGVDDFRFNTDPTHSLSGAVYLGPNQPFDNVTLTLDSGHSTTSDSAGHYAFFNLDEGSYVVTPSKENHVFSPPSLPVTIPPDATNIDFFGRTTSPFLIFPAAYSESEKSKALLYGRLGYVNAYFDHEYPNYQESITNPIVRYDGRRTYLAYGGHDGIDFDDNNDVAIVTEAVAAATGYVFNLWDKCQISDGIKCGNYLGNRVEIDHRNGYRTVYGHLAYDSLEVFQDTEVTAGQPLGIIGSTGNSTGPHIHFGVDAYTKDGWQKVDPFGWEPGDNADVTNDPWVQDKGGPESNYLWTYYNQNGISYEVNVGTSTSDPADFAGIEIPPSTDGGEAEAVVTNDPVPDPESWRRSLGRYFNILIEWLSAPASDSYMVQAEAMETYEPPITISMPFEDTDLLHLDQSQLSIHHWNGSTQIWDELPTTIDSVAHTATAVTTLTGDFELQAPLLCPADDQEIDDDPESSVPIWLNDSPVTRLLDISVDSDWFIFNAMEGIEYAISTQNLAGGSDTVLNLYARDGTTVLASNDDVGLEPRSELTWQAPATNIYFIKVSSSLDGATGCSSSYELLITGNPPPDTSLARVLQDIEIRWLHENAAVHTYEVWQHISPYFEFDTGSGASFTPISALELGYTLSFVDAISGVNNQFYKVRGVTDTASTPSSAEYGAFTFDLVPGE